MVALNRQFQHKSITTPSSGGSMATPTTLPNVDAQESWNLDGMGNWRSLTYTAMGDTPSVQQRSHNRLNQITNLGGRAFTYDGSPGASNGNLADDSFRAYQFDALNRQIQVNSAGSGTVLGSYVFDAFNRRIRKTISNGGFGGGIANGTTDYIHLGNQVMEERNPFGGTGSTDTPIRQYIWGTYPGAAALTRPFASTGFRQQNTGLGSLNIDECIQLTTLIPLGPQSLSPGTYFLLQDLLYRAVALTSSSGNNVEAYDTDAYGKTLIFTAPGPDGIWFTDDDVQSSYGANDIIYCGYRFDPETELYYVRARTYNPTLGRWIQRDPIGFAGGVNLYEYVGGRAVVGLDAMGRGGRVPPGFNQGGNSHPPNPRIRDGGACCLRWGEFWQEFGYRSYSQCVQQEHDMLSPFPSQPSDWIGLGLGLAGKTGAVTVVSIGLSVYEAFLWDTVEDQCSEQLCLEAGTYNCQGQCV